MLSSSVVATSLPAESRLNQYRQPSDFLDCYGVACDLDARFAAEIITDFPRWVQNLLVVRRLVTAPFGLDQDGPEASDRIGIFPVEHSDTTEVIAGFDDKHLNFRVSVMAKNGQVTLATWVHPHNIGGKAYLAAIMPFHVLVARDALSRVEQMSRPKFA